MKWLIAFDLDGMIADGRGPHSIACRHQFGGDLGWGLAAVR
jgi:hypothetical protein